MRKRSRGFLVNTRSCSSLNIIPRAEMEPDFLDPTYLGFSRPDPSGKFQNHRRLTGRSTGF